MNYKINKEGIISLEHRYWILSGELNDFSISELDTIIKDMNNVLEGKYSSSSFSKNIITVNFDNQKVIIEDLDKVIGEEKTTLFFKAIKELINIKRKNLTSLDNLNELIFSVTNINFLDIVILKEKHFEYNHPKVTIHFNCLKCCCNNNVDIINYQTGRNFNDLVELGKIDVEYLLKNDIVRYDKAISKYYIIQKLPTLYELLSCDSCQEKYMMFFSLGEYQPGRDICEVSGLLRIDLGKEV
ncbi:hypothetical protein [Aquimarina brevivitae]|uniref:Uncharacterized protein n=1 Tax=Aquimarina brevivitae TaxID=323412 RepID=A0A4Q7NYN0_9FLAO|nr:hypothetical protein [Aquimarina brevivitae]RZS92435.1 hypothetical protein EV197_2573 [Aquimarina brevivitae]